MSTITTFSGISFAPVTPDIDKIKIEDIAHSLSLLCRANGHFIRFFSVAQHAINCTKEAAARGYSTRVQLACLLHDASESYMSDVTRPVKKLLPIYVEIEENLQNAIYAKFLGSALAEDENMQMREIDDDMLESEFVVLLPKREIRRIVSLKTNPTYEFENFDKVESEFLQLFHEIVAKIGR